LRGWLVVILKNIFLNESRKRAREVEDAGGRIAEAVLVDDRTLLKMEAAEALRQVSDLPRALQRPLRLIIDGASYDEASRALRMNAGTVRSRVNRARNLLKSAQ
jgi:RNA polymerase sigma-70 factor (ECF subfamily)